MQHLQNNGGEVGAQNFRIGKFRAPKEVLFAVQTHADTRLDPAATTFTLIGAGLGNRFDRQALHLGPIAVAADARGAAVDHIANARYGQRSLSDVGRQHHAAARMRLENPLLFSRRQARVQRQDFGVLELGLAQHIGGVANLPLAGQEHQHIAGAAPFAALVGGDFVEGGEDRLIDGEVVLDPVALFVLLQRQRSIPSFHREGTARYFDDRRVIEVLGEALQIDGRRSNDDLQVGTAWQQGFQVAEEEIDVEAAFVGFVDDDRVVAFQITIVLGFRQQNAVGHQLDQGVGIALILEAHLIADQRTERRAELFGDTAGDTARGDPTRLGMADQTVLAAPDFQADLRQLGGFARTGFAGDDQHLMLLQGLLDLVALGRDRQTVVVTNHRQARAARQHLITGRLHPHHPLCQFGFVGFLAQLKQLPPQPVTVGEHGVIEVFQQFVDGGRFVGHRVGNSVVYLCRGRIVAEKQLQAPSYQPQVTAAFNLQLEACHLQLRLVIRCRGPCAGMGRRR